MTAARFCLRLRPERDLAEHYDVSYGTIRRAMEVLRERRLVETSHGRGGPERCPARIPGREPHSVRLHPHGVPGPPGGTAGDLADRTRTPGGTARLMLNRLRLSRRRTRA
jgi:DNA-binding transcriptional MocR family regulator